MANGKQERKWTQYYDEGNIASEMNYKESKLFGIIKLCKMYYSNNQVAEEVYIHSAKDQ